MNEPLFLSPADNELVCALVVARLVAACRLAPRSHRMPSAGSLAFTAAVRMVHRVHGHAAIDRLLAQPDIASGLADVHVLVLHVADLPDRRHAIDQHLARLAGRQLHQRVLIFFCDELRRSAGRAHHLRAFARLEFDVVDRGAGRNVLQRQRVPHQNVGLRTADDLLAHVQSHGMKDVALLAVGIRDQRNARRAVGIVLDRNHGRRDAALVALEVNLAQLALVPAATMPDGDVARIAASAGAQLDAASAACAAYRSSTRRWSALS